MTAVTALTERMVQVALRDFDFVLGLIAPLATLLGLNFALQHIIDTGDVLYVEYVLPATIIQSMLLGAVTAADRAAWDQASGFAIRLRAQPISILAPMAARMNYSLLRGVLGLAVAVATAYLLGFRMSGGIAATAAFVAIPLLLTLAMSLGADAIGTWFRKSGAGQLLLLPQLVLVLVSTGLAPVDAFPEWVQPFVAHQPFSQITGTMRNLSSGNVAAGELLITTAWCLGLLAVLGTFAVRMQRRPL